MKKLIIVLISLITFNTYSALASNSAEKEMDPINSSELINSVNSNFEPSVLFSEKTETISENDPMFEWACFAHVVAVIREEGVDGSIHTTTIVAVRCYYYTVPPLF